MTQMTQDRTPSKQIENWMMYFLFTLPTLSCLAAPPSGQKLFPPLDNNITVERVEFHQEWERLFIALQCCLNERKDACLDRSRQIAPSCVDSR